MWKHLPPIYLTICCAIGLMPAAHAQEEASVEIQAELEGNSYLISIDPNDLPTLEDDGSGNEPYYSYYWEFGDYQFAHTILPEVRHAYPSDLVGEEVDIRLYLKAHYALSPSIVRKPLRGSLRVEAGSATGTFEDVPAGLLWLSSSDYGPAQETPGAGEEGKTTHQIQEREDFVLIVSIKAPEGRSLQGATVELDIRKYHQFFTFNSWRFDDQRVAPLTELEPGRRLPSQLTFSLDDFGERPGTNIFIDLTPDRSGKKNALGKTIEVTANIQQEDAELGAARLDLEVVESRDPNRMLVADTYIENWKQFLAGGLTYRVDFQNYGSGPVENGISIDIDLPAGADPSTFRLLAHHSAACSSIKNDLIPCDTLIDRSQKSMVTVNLDDAGLTSKDADERRSKGFIAYRIKPKPTIGKCNWKSQAEVQFTSARRTARTNKVSTSFKGTFSLGLKTMVNFYPGDKASYYSAGLVLGSDVHCRSDSRLSVMFGVERLDSLFQPHDNYYLDIALTPFRIEPIRVQNGAWTFLGTGLGAQFSMAFLKGSDKRPVNTWTAYGDVTLVSRRKGPRLGVQYHIPFSWPKFTDDFEGGNIDLANPHWQFYFTWAF